MIPTGYATAGLIIIAAICGGFGYWQYNRAEDLLVLYTKSEERRKDDSIEFMKAKSELEQSIVRLEGQRDLDQLQLNTLTADINRVSKERDDEKAKLESYRNRLSRVALAKPGLVGRAATHAVERVFRDVGRASEPTGYPNVGKADEADASPAAPGR